MSITTRKGSTDIDDIILEIRTEFNVKFFCDDLYGGYHFIENLKQKI